MLNDTAVTDATRIQVDVIKRTAAPETTDGKRWHVQLSAVPAREWLELFKVSGRSDGTASPHLVVFDRDSASFRSDEAHVEQWIEALDRWIASTDARYGASLEEANRERSLRLDAEATRRERIQQLNDRFRNL